MKAMIATAAILMATGTPVSAQEITPGLSDRYTGCVARAGRNTVQSGLCAQSELAAQDARLNKSYQQVMRQLASQPARRTALRNAQRSWLRARDYACKIDQDTIDNTCLVTRTAARANELESRIRF